MNSIPKDSQKLDSQSVWLGPSGNDFYTWAGEKHYNGPLPDKEIWRFTANGSGGGKWAKSPPSNLDTFQDLVRPTDGTFTQSNDTGYYFGGIVRRRSDYYISDWNVSIPTPGLVSYNMTSGEIKNTTSEFGQYGTFKEGSSQFLPFGDAGVLLFLGGKEAPVTSREDDWKEIDFNQVTLFDIKGQKWYTQDTTGPMPAARRRFCTTGVLGPNNTFEVFIYGGWGSKQGVLSDVYVLSVPGFRFFKASGDSTPRFDQACVVVGRRQMLSIGGIRSTNAIQGWTEPDPWPYGLGVFDMTEMIWKDGYSADDAAYESPEIVKQWYKEGGQNSVSWANEEVKLLFLKSIIIGQYVYIDGGEVSQYEGEYNETYSYPSWPVNSTISIGLSEHWDTSNVTMKTTPKDPSNVLNGQAIWKDPASNAFYTWGGWKTSMPPDKKMMRFSADDNGGGTWTEVTTPNLQTIDRTREGTFSQSKNVGYYFGGFTSKETDSNFVGTQNVQGRPAPGLVSFHMQSRDMRNISSSRFGKHGTFKGGSSQFVPFGPEGLLVVLGGWEASVSVTRFENWDAMAFDKISVYDPRGDQWYYQQTTGDNPFPKEKFCITGAPGPNNTYEIFIYGGRETKTVATSNEVHVLSLPGFNFFKADNKLSTQRADHACTVIGGRQMLSVGGLLPEIPIGKRFSKPDPWPLGLGIFDMTELRWTNRYDPNAGGYDSPKVVKDWYSQGNVAKWASPELKALFAQWSPNATVDGASEVGLPGDTESQSSESQPSGPNIGAIVGGAVGGVAALVLVAGLALFFMRRRKRQVVAAPDSSPAPKFGSVGTAHTTPALTEIHEAQSYNLSELSANYGVPPGSHGPQSRHEMAA
ncbi:Kelch repeat-containing protein [Colletotrichum siamense]|uniref:Kelch repeat-containing protein n=1 Tax=Colletotrichum siamense TaxID=690259 RepID=UPI001872439C|nr:Kelch repeat-containing protein [Colletotrichum siamense]KAF5505300.1 Kelch repeat-containing protein [Colletotrichum siamense]